MDQNVAWNRFILSGKIEDYLAYRNTFLTVGDLSAKADKDRRNRDKTTEI